MSGRLLTVALLLQTAALGVLLGQSVASGSAHGPWVISSPAVATRAQITRPNRQEAAPPSFVPIGTPAAVYPRRPCGWLRLNDARALRCPVWSVPERAR